jgi:hypothetical protein
MSTHDWGIALETLPDFVRLLDLVAADARGHRVQRADRPTHPAISCSAG